MTAATLAQSREAAPATKQIGRVVIASINRPEGDTGVHTHTRMLCDGLHEAGVQCDLVSAFSGSRKWMPIFALRPLILHRVNKSWSTLWHRRWHRAALREALLAHAKQHKPDAILAQCPVSARAALDVRAQLRADFVVAMVCHFNHSEAAEYRDKGELAGRRRYDEMLRFEDTVLSEVDRVIYVSHWARDSVEQSRGLRTCSSAVIWNGVNDGPIVAWAAGPCATAPAETQRLTPQITGEAARATTLTRRELGLADDAIVLINVGSLEPRKNQLGLLPLFAEINAQHPQTRLVLVGDGPQRNEIERKIAQLELSGAVTLLGHRRDVPAILPLADLYVHYASLENCPLALIESARAGVPFAAVPAGGVPELQTALGCRIDLTPHDLRQSLDSLRPLLEDAEQRQQQGKIARERFVATFTHQAMTRAYLEALSTIR